MLREPAEPWRSFLAELDARAEHEVGMHCCGGFVVTTVYGLARTTADLDVLAIVPSDQQRELARFAGRGSIAPFISVATSLSTSRRRQPLSRGVMLENS